MTMRTAARSTFLLLGLLVAFYAHAEAGRVLAVPDGTLSLDDTGEGPAVVFLHGAFLDRRTWDGQIAALSAYRTVRYDIRPFGQSTLRVSTYRPREDLLSLLDELKVDRAHLVGHSFGAQVAVDFALAHPQRVASLILLSPGLTGHAFPPGEMAEWGKVFKAARLSESDAVDAWMQMSMWAAARERPHVTQLIARMTEANAGLFSKAAPPFLPFEPVMDRLGTLRMPVLVLVGDRDTPGNREAAAALARGAPQGTLVTIAGADHALPIGWIEETNKAVKSFLSAQRTP